MKKFTLGIAALFAAFTMNSQNSCADAEVINVGADASTTVNASQITGTAPTVALCNGYYGLSDITAANWYSYTNNSGQDLLVTVTTQTPQTGEYYPAFTIFSGTCSSLSCESGLPTLGDGQGNVIAPEIDFLAEDGQTYYIVFDNNNEIGFGTANTAFDFTVTTDSNVPAAPGVATNPTPANGATDVEITTNTQGFTAIEFRFDAPTTGGTVEEYLLAISTDQQFSQGNTISATIPVNASTPTTGIGGVLGLGDQDWFDENTTYYWQVISENVSDAVSSGVWSFTTEDEETMDVTNVQQDTFSHYISNGQLHLRANSSLESVELYNLLGQQVASQKLSNSKEENIDIDHLQTGMYLAQVQVEGKTKTFKFVKK